MVRYKTVILVVVIVLIVLSIYSLESTKIKISPGISQQLNFGDNIQGDLAKAPDLVGISGYINTDEDISIKKLNSEGKIVLVDFWTYTCINCIRTLPYLKEWHEKYYDKGLVIIGVHTPEFSYEKKYENVLSAVNEFEISYPVVQDNDYLTWNAFGNRYWPRKYLIDTKGNIRYDHIGEGSYKETEEKIQELLKEIGQDVSDMDTVEDPVTITLSKTQELYVGHAFALSRGQNLGNKEGLVPQAVIDYSLPETLDEISPDKVYVQGKWRNNPDNLQLTEGKGKIVLKFTGNEVNIVADSLKQSSINIDVSIDGVKTNTISVNEPKLYTLYKKDYGQHTLEITIPESDFIFSSFTFG